MNTAKTAIDIMIESAAEKAMLTQRIGELVQQVNERDSIITLVQKVCGNVIIKHDEGSLSGSGDSMAIETLRSLMADIYVLTTQSKGANHE